MKPNIWKPNREDVYKRQAYSIAKEGTAWPKWEGGSKEKPAKGEYMVGQSTSSIIVQILSLIHI